MVGIDQLLKEMMDKKASDLHIIDGCPPAIRLDGEVVQMDYEPLSPEDTQVLVYSLLTEKQKAKFESESELDLGFGIKGLGRIRMNVYRQRGAVCAAMRAIPYDFMTFEELGLPPLIHQIVKMRTGLVLVTGPTGSGKSTTLASIINYLNENRSSHIVTIEDPIEYVHSHKKCLVSQREVGADTETFSASLKHVMRQDPDIILIGEMRDLETIEAALTVAETGHLAFATLHTPDAVQSINRIIDVFPPHQQPQIRSQLSFVLQAVFCQELLKKQGGGRAMVCEALLVTPAIRNMIREEKAEQAASAMQSGGRFGMQTKNTALYDAYKKRYITKEQVYASSNDVEEIKRLMGRGVL
ncbi:MAG: PilT/PilU family type 4a pilus ATPase [Candidatus Omnitrophota bacterium]|nr:PilT/PilU family type 4a pilus ATPase [Candidatus Omnitrophota bacterium]MBU2528709.1 PilT/PilU family type 4a pilus ATPase [bacterium]MBU3929400.1 PilT/PilU family type 4a pilus ATPase [bacterium]MBU4123776.1 PilT/PilU family type 4a pilus ATPase [bacterium]